MRTSRQHTRIAHCFWSGVHQCRISVLKIASLAQLWFHLRLLFVLRRPYSIWYGDPETKQGRRSCDYLETNSLQKDEENGTTEPITGKQSASDNDESEKSVEGVAKNETIFTFQNITYTIPYEKGERTLLQSVNGFVKPGKLTALMGASGAGKTTLLNTLAQRINFGVVHGDFLVDGTPLPSSFQRSTGFAEQMDVHESTATVREALQFSAKLRQPKETPLQEKYDYVETIIDLLEMRDIAGAAIGSSGNGLNQEQRKRLTIGVELASKPELLMFLDEPTSGLDSGAAFNIVRFLRKLADAGQAILCTIHQPSAVLFEHFDQLLLLKSGGRTVYFGELGHDSRNLLEYLERNGAKKCPPKENPAEFMLEAIGAGNPDCERSSSILSLVLLVANYIVTRRQGPRLGRCLAKVIRERKAQ
jgi:ATP-binding cassette subfamily G (WHITE) protein 2 (SNQ2)